MGLIGALLTLPLAPARGVFWVAEQIADAADREVRDPAVVRARLAALNAEFESGVIDVEEFEREEELLLAGLEPSRTVAVSSEKATE